MSSSNRPSNVKKDEPPRGHSVVWTERARRDLIEIGDYISLDNPKAARLWLGSILESIERIEKMPHSGRIVPEIGRKDLREIIKGNYRVVYRLTPTTIQILTVFEGHRLLRTNEFAIGEEGTTSD